METRGFRTGGSGVRRSLLDDPLRGSRGGSMTWFFGRKLEVVENHKPKRQSYPEITRAALQCARLSQDTNNASRLLDQTLCSPWARKQSCSAHPHFFGRKSPFHEAAETKVEAKFQRHPPSQYVLVARDFLVSVDNVCQSKTTHGPMPFEKQSMSGGRSWHRHFS